MVMMTCGCGRPLKPVVRDGKRIGVTHDFDDEEHHLEFFSTFKIERSFESH